MDHKAVLILFLLTLNNVLSETLEDGSLEKSDKGPGGSLVSVDNDYKDHGGLFNYVKLDANELVKDGDEDEQLLQTVEVAVPDDGNQPVFRAYAREYAKKRDFLQCKDEEPIVYLCSKSCHNVFKSVCNDFRCPPRLVVQTTRDCFEACKKTYKGFRGQKYIPPEKY